MNNTPEKYLLEALDRVAKNSTGYAVLYVSISKLKPKNRHPDFVKILARLFDSVVGSTRGAFFILSNGDFVILGKDITSATVDEAVNKLKEGLSSDPVIHGKNIHEFARVHEFPHGFKKFYQYIEDMSSLTLLTDYSYEWNQKRSLEPHEIEDIVTELDRIDIAEIVKRQSIMNIKSANNFEVSFQEFFVAVKDLALNFSNDIDLVANRWLFMYLTQALDKKTLSAFRHAELNNWPKAISVNLNLSSIFSKEFEDFFTFLPSSHQQIIVEVKLMDVFNNLNLYRDAVKVLHENGHKVLFDEMSPAMMKMVNVELLNPDYVKIFWEPLLGDGSSDEALKDIIKVIGRENVILAKCDSDKAVKWGVAHGISKFQGPFVDNIETAMIRSKCPDAKNCTTQICLKRRRLLMGALRDGCSNKAVLEDLL